LNLQDDLENVLIIDIDDTCVDTLSSFIKWLATLGRLKKIEIGRVIEDRENLGDWLGIPNELVALWLKEFNEYSWQWGAMHPCLLAEKVLPTLANNGWHIIGYSKATSELSRSVLRRANLELLFPGVFKELFVVKRDANIYSMLKEYDDAICVTSTISGAQASAQVGHATYLMQHPWNSNFSGLSARKFKNWKSIEEVLLKIPAT
jgi:hypothetical protein